MPGQGILCRCCSVDNCIVLLPWAFLQIYFEFAERAKVICAARKYRKRSGGGGVANLLCATVALPWGVLACSLTSRSKC